MYFSFTFNIDENVIKVHYHVDIELLYHDIINIAFKRNWYIGQAKRYYLVFEVAVTGFENRFLFIAFFDLYLMVDIS